MNDKEWLERVSIALAEYEKKFGSQVQAASFVNWLYHQYGIVKKETK